MKTNVFHLFSLKEDQVFVYFAFRLIFKEIRILIVLTLKKYTLNFFQLHIVFLNNMLMFNNVILGFILREKYYIKITSVDLNFWFIYRMLKF